jgi:hypothetical protein
MDRCVGSRFVEAAPVVGCWVGVAVGWLVGGALAGELMDDHVTPEPPMVPLRPLLPPLLEVVVPDLAGRGGGWARQPLRHVPRGWLSAPPLGKRRNGCVMQGDAEPTKSSVPVSLTLHRSATARRARWWWRGAGSTCRHEAGPPSSPYSTRAPRPSSR